MPGLSRITREATIAHVADLLLLLPFLYLGVRALTVPRDPATRETGAGTARPGQPVGSA